MLSLVRFGREATVIIPRIYELLLPSMMALVRYKSGTLKKETDRALVYLLQLRKVVLERPPRFLIIFFLRQARYFSDYSFF